MGLRFLSLRHALGLVASAGILLSSNSAFAAERVVLKYRSVRVPISVNELSTFAETGQQSLTLQAYMKVARQDPKVVRRTLTQPVKVNPLLLDGVLNNRFSNMLVDEISKVVHTPSRQADRQALRSALVLSARDDSNIKLIETIQNYPTSDIEVEGDRLESGVRQITRLAERLQNLLGSIGQSF